MAEESESRNSSLIDFGPLVAFALTYKLKDIYWATGVLMVAMSLALGYTWLREKRLPVMPLVTFVIVLVFGGMTVVLHDPKFIYIKPTIVTSLVAVVLLGGLFFRRGLLKPMFGSSIEMDDEGWRKLSLRFALLSFGIAALNEAVWRSVTPDGEHYWVWFKFLGIPGLTLGFLLSQRGLMKEHATSDDEDDEEADEDEEEAEEDDEEAEEDDEEADEDDEEAAEDDEEAAEDEDDESAQLRE